MVARLKSLVMTAIFSVAACGSPSPSAAPHAASIPAFAVPGALLTVAPGSTLLVYSADRGTDLVTQLEEGALIQLVDLSDEGRFKIQYPDRVEGALFGWAVIGGGVRTPL